MRFFSKFIRFFLRKIQFCHVCPAKTTIDMQKRRRSLFAFLLPDTVE